MSITSRSRRIAVSMAGAALVSAALVSGAGTAAAAPGPPAAVAAPAGNSIVGTWKGTATIRTKTGTVIGRPTFVFTPSGKICLSTETSDGSGTYTQAGAAFAYRVLERQDDPALGTIRINQAGRQQGNSFTSAGISLVFDASGRQTGTAVTTVKATRTSTSTAGC